MYYFIRTEELLQQTLCCNRENRSGKVQYGDGGGENLRVWGFVVYFYDIGPGWVGTNVWCKMKKLSGKVKHGNVWDEKLRVWGFVVYFCDVGSGWVGTNVWCKMEKLSGKIKHGNVWDENLWVWGFVGSFCDVGSGCVRTNAWCSMVNCCIGIQERWWVRLNFRIAGFAVYQDVGSGWSVTNA